MLASGKPVWYLLLAAFATAGLLFTFLGLGYDRYIFAHSEDPYPEQLTNFLSVDTITALQDDARLHHALLELTESIAHTSSDFGQRFGVGSMEEFGSSLTDSITELRKRNDIRNEKRGLLDSFTSAVGNLLGFNATGGIAGIAGNIGSALTKGIATPALFLGIGVGVGATTGLNLTDMASAAAQATRVATTFNATATGLNLAAQNLGSGVSGLIAPAVGKGGGGMLMSLPIASAAFALASGIGNSTAKAFNLTTEEFGPSNASGIEAIAGNLGLGVTTPIVSNIDFQALMKGAGGSGIASSLMQQLPQLAAAAGNGLGEGARNGLGLVQSGQSKNLSAKRQASPDPLQGVDLPGTVNQFTKGLSQSLLSGVDIASLAGNLKLPANLPTMLDPNLLPSLAGGAGSGIGMGLAIGLALKSASAMPLMAQVGNASSGNMQPAMAAQAFTQNLLSNFLLNSTFLQTAQTMLSKNQPQFIKNIDVAKAAEGFARGAIEGVSTALSSVGGAQNLINGNFSDDALMNVPVLDPSKFNDSLNGSAIAFARGITGEGTILVGEVLKKFKQNANNKRSFPVKERDVNMPAGEAAIVPYSPLKQRQTQNDTNQDSSFPLAINEGTIMTGGQLAIDTLSCEGIGGLASAALGAFTASKKKPSMMDMMSVPFDPRAIGSLPPGPVEFKSEGNTFRIMLRAAELSVNGLPVIPFAIITALHVLFIGLAFLLLLPFYLILGVVWRLSVLAGYPVNEVKNKKWRLGLLIGFAITAIIGLVLGVVGMGNSRHFRDVHGILGLVALILVIPTVGFTIARLRSEALYPEPATFVGIKAPLALFKSPDQRIYVISGILIQIIFAIGQVNFINGFSTLRSISLCVVDAVLTSTVVAGLMGIVLMVQITAAGMVGIRSWLEQHIAKREKAGVQRMVIVEAGEKASKDFTEKSGFGDTRSNAPSPLDLKRPAVVQRNTEELRGFSDENISTPSKTRKEGAEDPMAFENPRQLTRQQSMDLRDNPFLSAAEQRDLDERVYPKTADYQNNYKSAIDDNTDYYNVPVGYKPQLPEIRSGRPSSDLINPLNSPLPSGLGGQKRESATLNQAYGSPPKTQGVTVADLFPPPPPPPMDSSASSSFSRPLNAGKRQSGDALRGFAGGPGDTVRVRDSDQ